MIAPLAKSRAPVRLRTHRSKSHNSRSPACASFSLIVKHDETVLLPETSGTRVRAGLESPRGKFCDVKASKCMLTRMSVARSDSAVIWSSRVSSLCEMRVWLMWILLVAGRWCGAVPRYGFTALAALLCMVRVFSRGFCGRDSEYCTELTEMRRIRTKIARFVVKNVYSVA